MKFTISTFAMLLCIVTSLCAQRKADWTVPVTGTPEAVLFQSMTGVPIVQTNNAYIGINPATKQVAWTVDRSAMKALSAVVETEADFYDMLYTPYVIVRNSVLDSRDGKILLDKAAEDFKKISDYEVIPAINGVLVRAFADGKVRMYLLDMATNKIIWKVDIGKAPGISLSRGDDEPTNLDLPIGTTLVSKTGTLICKYKKSIVAVNSNNGQLLWEDKAEPGQIYFSPDEKNVLVVEGSDNVLNVAMGAVFTKKIKAYDLVTGVSPWKEEIEAKENIRWVDVHPDYLVVVHKKGCNLYNYATGEKMWKKDFEGRRVIEIAPNAEGYLVTFWSGSSTMQVDKGGKELWKKPQRMETDDDEVDVPEDGGVDRYTYDKGVVIVTADVARFYPKKGSGAKRWRMAVNPSTQVAYDPSRKNIIILDKNDLLVVNPDKFPKTVAEAKVDMENPYSITKVEIRPNGYFLSSEHEYIVLNPDDMKVMHHYYKPPFDSKKLLINAVSAGLSVGGAVAGVAGVSNAMMGGAKATGSVVGLTPPGSGNTELQRADNQIVASNVMSDMQSMMPDARFKAFKESRDYAYFLAKDKESKEVVLIRVSKDDGTEKEKLIFDTARPVYEVDEIEKRVYLVSKGLLQAFQM